MTTTTAEKPNVAIASLTAEANGLVTTLRRMIERERRAVAEENLPGSDSDAERCVGQFVDPLARLWSYANVGTQHVESGDATIAAAQQIHTAIHAALDHAATIREAVPATVADIRAREQRVAEVAALRTAASELAAHLERAGETHAIFVKYVGQGVAVLLRLDRRIRIRTLRGVLETARQNIAAVRAAAEAHQPLRTAWETRLGRAFDLADLPVPIIREK